MLWRAHLETLKGFYQSDVLVSAESREAAMEMALRAIQTWHATHVEEYLFSPVVSSYEGDEGYAEEFEDWIQEVLAELEEKLAQVEGDVLVMRKI